MTAIHDRSPRVGEAMITMHFEAQTDECPCPKLQSCGGILPDAVDWDCPEHGWAMASDDPLMSFHSHPVQVAQVNRGVRHRSEWVRR